MPEGHSVVRWARALVPLIGEPLETLDAPKKWQALTQQMLFRSNANKDSPLSLVRIYTHGKHLFLHLSDGRAIHCHGMMYGSWQVGKSGMPLRKDESRVRLRLRSAKNEAVFFNGPVVEFLTPEELKHHKTVRALGPDILHINFDRTEVFRRLQLKKNLKRPIGEAILDQTILAGIGNIFKSEGLFLARIDPRRPVSDFSRKEFDHLWNTIFPIMQAAVRSRGAVLTLPANLRRGKTGRGARNFVYFRTAKPCYFCSTPIVRIVQGEMERSTYFCPRCQR
jgi:endonuclease VIII